MSSIFDEWEGVDDAERERHERLYQALLARHPQCIDPEHPGCDACEVDDE